VNSEKISEYHQECLDHFNEPMISFGELVRCVGYGSTLVDSYIITKKKNGKIVWNTFVGGYIFLNPLRGINTVIAPDQSTWDDLDRLDNELSRAGCLREETMIVE
jgi:hypothetical protein